MVRRTLWLVPGFVLLGVGAVVLLSADGVADFGWFAYSPLRSGIDLTAQAVILSRDQVVGIALGALGLVFLAGGLGYVIGRRGRA